MMTKNQKLLSLFALTALLAGCASGGSPGTDAATSPAPAPATVTSATLAMAAPTKAETAARTLQPWQNQVNLPYANQLGTGNGAGVVVGLVDSGIQVNHPELAGQVVASYNAFNGGTDIADQIGHGTHTAGLIVGTLAKGASMQGVAPGAKLAVAKVFANGTSDSVTVGKAIDWEVNVQKVPIISLSLGVDYPVLDVTMKNAMTKSTLVVAAAGNSSYTDKVSYPAGYAKESWAKGQVIVVGAMDANNVRASFSNYDPTVANWTVYAPGVNVGSSYWTATTPSVYAELSGTSMATPIVAGQAALIKSNWNFLGAGDVAQVIFKSATRICSDGSAAALCAARTTADPMYGWGLVNIAASLQPLGDLKLTNQSGATVTRSGGSLATPKSGMASGLSGVSSIAVDSFNRGFNVNIPSSSTSTTTTVTALPAQPAATTTTGTTKANFEFSAIPGANGRDFADKAALVTKSSVQFAGSRGEGYGLGFGGTEDKFFGLEAAGSTPLSFSGEHRFNSPFFALAQNSSHVGYAVTLDDGTVVRTGLLAQSSAALGSTDTSGGKLLAAVELQRNYGASTGVLTIGQMQETNSLMGLTGSGALAMSGHASTTYLTIAGSTPVAERTTLSAMFSLGGTAAYRNKAASFIDGTSASLSSAWSFGLAQSDVLTLGDRFGLSVSMPLRTMTGSLHVTTAVGQNQTDGSLQYATSAYRLAPSGIEKDVELSYSLTTRSGAKLTALAQAKFQPGHLAGAATQYGFGARFNQPF